MGSGPARALYYFRTGDILDNKILDRMKTIARKAEFGEQGTTSVCDRLMQDLRSKAAKGEIDYMVVYTDVNDKATSLGVTDVVRTTHVVGHVGNVTTEEGQEHVGE